MSKKGEIPVWLIILVVFLLIMTIAMGTYYSRLSDGGSIIAGLFP